MDYSKQKATYLIDWLNSLNISSCLLLTSIHELYDGRIFLDLLSHLLNKTFTPSNTVNNTSKDYSVLVAQIMKDYFYYTYDIENKDTDTEVISLLDYLKIIYDKQGGFLQPSEHTIATSEGNTCKNYDKKVTEEYLDNNNEMVPLNGSCVSTLNNNCTTSKEMYKTPPITSLTYYNKNTLFILGIPSITKDSTNISMFRFIKPTSPVLICQPNTKPIYMKLTYINNFAYAQSNPLCNIQREREETEERNQKEKFILSRLRDWRLLKNKKHFYGTILPRALDGTFIGKLINIWENKKEDVLKGISLDTYLKTTIKSNFNKINNYLANKTRFNNSFPNILLVDNYWENEEGIIDLLYAILMFYNKGAITSYNSNKSINSSMLRNISREGIKDNHNKSSNSLSKIRLWYDYNSVNRSGKAVKTENNNYYILYNKNSAVNAHRVINQSWNKTQKMSIPIKQIQAIDTSLLMMRKNIQYEHYSTASNGVIRNNSHNKKNDDKNNNTSDLKQHPKASTSNSNKKTVIKPWATHNMDKRTNRELSKSCLNNKNNNNSFDRNDNTIDKTALVCWLSTLGINIPNFHFNTKKTSDIFQDGIIFYNIISKLEHNSNLWPKIEFHPKNKVEAINNIKRIITMLAKYKKNFPLLLLNKAPEIYNCDTEMIVLLLRVIKDCYNDVEGNNGEESGKCGTRNILN